MGDDFERVPLSLVAKISSGKRPPVVSKEFSSELLVPVIGGGGPSGFTSSALFDEPVLITGRVGTLGKLHLSSGPCYPSDNALVITAVHDVVDFVFLRYSLSEVIEQAVGLNRGAANPLVTQGDLGELLVSCPPLAEQKGIAHILGTLDDKIELNRRMNQTLEALARALFKSWFVDFDPVRIKEHAKAIGTSPNEALAKMGVSAELADLFPDTFEDSELGEIPKGWRVGKFTEAGSIHKETINPALFPDEVFDHYSLPAFDEGKMPVPDLGSSIKSNKTTIPSGAVLLSKLNPRIQRIWRPLPDSTRRQICSTEFLVISPRKPITSEYIYGLFVSDFFQSVYGTLVTGTSGSHQRVKPAYLESMDLIMPPSALADCYTRKVSPALGQADRNLLQSQTLTNLRDALLPKLLSGEVRVKVRVNTVDILEKEAE